MIALRGRRSGGGRLALPHCLRNTAAPLPTRCCHSGCRRQRRVLVERRLWAHKSVRLYSLSPCQRESPGRLLRHAIATEAVNGGGQ